MVCITVFTIWCGGWLKLLIFFSTVDILQFTSSHSFNVRAWPDNWYYLHSNKSSPFREDSTTTVKLTKISWCWRDALWDLARDWSHSENLSSYTPSVLLWRRSISNTSTLPPNGDMVDSRPTPKRKLSRDYSRKIEKRWNNFIIEFFNLLNYCVLFVLAHLWNERSSCSVWINFMNNSLKSPKSNLQAARQGHRNPPSVCNVCPYVCNVCPNVYNVCPDVYDVCQNSECV